MNFFSIFRVFVAMIFGIVGLMSWPHYVFAQENMYIRPVDVQLSRWFVYDVDPGGEIRDSVRIVNNADYVQHVRIRAVDAQMTKEGGFSLKSSEPEKQQNIGAWVNLKNAESIFIKPGETKDFPFVVRVPDNIEPGDYGGGFILERAEEVFVEDSDGSVSDSSRSEVRISVVASVGARIYVTVKGEKVFRIDWKDYSAERTADGINFSYVFTNQGNTQANLDATLRVKAPFLQSQNIKIPFQVLFPGVSLTPNYVWDNLPPLGKIVATTTVAYQRVDILGDPVQEAEEDSGTWEKTVSFWIIPWKEIFVSILVFLVVLGWLKYNEYRARRIQKMCVAYKFPQAQNLFDLASQFHVDWKQLAKINKIKAPYRIEPEQTILIPKLPPLNDS